MQRKTERSGGSKVRLWVLDQSSPPNGVAMRSGQPSAYPIGRRMSGLDSWASVDPSRSSTMECTIDWGCTTMSIRSYPMPKSSWASMTSRPLFMSVDESMVIFGPMDHVGWASASSTVTVRETLGAANPGTGRPTR